MAQVIAQSRLIETREIVKIREVPLNYNGDESTLLICCGASPTRVIVETAILGREIRTWCRERKGWAVDGLTLVVTDGRGRTQQYAPKQADRLLIIPTVRQLEWTRRAGEKG